MTLREVERLIEAEFYYAAVIIALTLPDICASLESEKAYSGRDEYKKWYRENLADKYPSMSDEMAYSLRCGVVHKGNTEIKTKSKSVASRVAFTLPHPRMNITLHNCMVGDDLLQFDAGTFCRDLVAAVRNWCEKTTGDPNVRKNLQGLVRLRPDGFPGVVADLPVIA
jgi:hypothetical protein